MNLQEKAFNYLKEIGHNWAYEKDFNSDLNYLDEAIENGFQYRQASTTPFHIFRQIRK